MFDKDIAKWKAEQDQLNERKAKLNNAFAPFRSTFIDGLTKFAKQAIEAGLEGVTEVKNTKIGSDVIAMQFGANGFDFTCIIPSDALGLDSDIGFPEEALPLSMRIFIFMNGDSPENDLPFVDVVATERLDGSHTFSIRWLLTTGRIAYVLRDHPLTPEYGKVAAAALIEHIYKIRPVWRDYLTRHKLLDGQDLKRPIGFELPD